MVNATLIWTPYPYKAGFCIIDDTDAATLEQTRAVYDLLHRYGILATKTVWPFRPLEKCGIPALPASTLRGITLEDNDYLDYCRRLHERGFEIALHGASAGNNTRGQTLSAFNLVEKEIGFAGTYVCHAQNADNIYWNEKITNLVPFRFLLRLISGKHRCSGEIAASPYYWGDICRERVNQVRLYRTRNTNTLAANPSMPYFSRQRPLVNSWFTATKRSFHDCTTPQAQRKLIKENGLTVLYQYMHRYASPTGDAVDRRFKNDVRSLAANPLICKDTVSNMMNRLRLMQGIFLFHKPGVIYLVNTNAYAAHNLQFLSDKRIQVTAADCTYEVLGKTLHIKELPASAIVKIEVAQSIQVSYSRAFKLGGKKRTAVSFSGGKLFLNLSEVSWQATRNITIPAYSFHLQAARAGTGFMQLSAIGFFEEIKLIMGQTWIIIREILFKGRSIDRNKFLDDSKEIRIEDHVHW